MLLRGESARGRKSSAGVAACDLDGQRLGSEHAAVRRHLTRKWSTRLHAFSGSLAHDGLHYPIPACVWLVAAVEESVVNAISVDPLEVVRRPPEAQNCAVHVVQTACYLQVRQNLPAVVAFAALGRVDVTAMPVELGEVDLKLATRVSGAVENVCKIFNVRQVFIPQGLEAFVVVAFVWFGVRPSVVLDVPAAIVRLKANGIDKVRLPGAAGSKRNHIRGRAVGNSPEMPKFEKPRRAHITPTSRTVRLTRLRTLVTD